MAEIADFFQRELFVSGEIQQRVDQHRAMARRQDETVTIRPLRRGCIKFQVFFKQHRGHIGHAHRHAGMAGIGGVNGIQRQGANGRGLHPVVGICLCKGGDINRISHGAASFLIRGLYTALITLSCKIKRGL